MGEWLSLASEGRVLAEVMSAMGYDAMAIGRMDLLKGLEIAQARAQETTFPLLSANLVSKSTQRPLFDPYAIIIKNGARIGIIGLTDEDSLAMPGLAEVAMVLDPQETARQLVPQVREHVDAIIILSRLGLDRDKALAQSVPGIQIIVGGKSRQLMREPERVANTLIVQQGYDGEWIGYLTASFDNQGTPSGVKMESIKLISDYPDDPQIVNIMRRFSAQYPAPTPSPMPTQNP